MISPEKATIESILKGTKIRYSVPKYQRSYDWGTGELEELIDDLKGIMSHENKGLFLGNFIFDVSDVTNYKIVDGQQRLTTISIIFIALREQAKLLNEHNIANEIQDYISIYSEVRGKNTVKFAVSENISVVYNYMSSHQWEGDFPSIIEERSVKRQIKRVKPIYDFIRESINEFNSENLKSFVRALWDTYVIVIKVEDTEDVFSVFERTNARGLDLNIGDLLKNYIFSYQDESLESKWAEIIDNCVGGLPRMLKYFWVSRKGYIQQSNLYKSLKSYSREQTDKYQNGIEIFVSELHEFSRYYKFVQSLDPNIVSEWFEEFGIEEISKNEDYYLKINRVLQALKLFKVTQAYPLIFSIFHSFKDSNLKTKRLFDVLKTIENYHFVNNIISGRVGHEVEKFYAQKAKDIFHTDDLNFEITNLINGLSKKRAHRDDFVSNFSETITYESKNIPLINYVFDRINNYDREKKDYVKGSQYVNLYSPEKNLRKRNYNVEHFLPQDFKKNHDDNEHEKFDLIGNLLVVSRHTNSAFGNKEPKEKIDLIKSDKKHNANLRYLDSFLEKYSDRFEDWSFDDINQRTTDLANLAYEFVWKF